MMARRHEIKGPGMSEAEGVRRHEKKGERGSRSAAQLVVKRAGQRAAGPDVPGEAASVSGRIVQEAL